MNTQQIQEIVKENSHGMLFGLISALVAIYFRKITSVEIIFWITTISIIIGLLITYYWKVPSKFLNYKTVLFIVGMITSIILFGEQTGLFAGVQTTLTQFVSPTSWAAKLVFLGPIGAFLSIFNIFLGIAALIIGLIVLGILIGHLITIITQNFVLVLIVTGIVFLFAIMAKRR